jgi:hypothetical protein
MITAILQLVLFHFSFTFRDKIDCVHFVVKWNEWSCVEEKDPEFLGRSPHSLEVGQYHATNAISVEKRYT